MTGEPKSHNVPPAADPAPRVQLILNSGAKAGMRIPCRRIVTLIGSRKGCKVNLRHEGVAPVHAAIVNDGSKIVAVNLAFRRGAKLNGLKMEQETLSHGDMLEIGPWEFRVEIGEGRTPQADDALPFALDQAPEAVALEHVETRRVLQPNREICVIGRRSGCDVQLDEERVSRAHALLVRYFGFPAVCDLLSTAGTLVNDERTSFRMLSDNDVLGIGESRFRVRLIGSKVGRSKAKSGQEREPKPPPPPSDGLIELEPAEAEGDLVDIQAVEGAERWRVADQYEKLARKS